MASSAKKATATQVQRAAAGKPAITRARRAGGRKNFARAKAAGATILSDIEQGPPGQRYRAEDIEGNRWFFFQREDK